MYTDMYGVTRLKINTHMHTTISDGRKTPEQAAEIYKNAGYDRIAFTDHRIYNPGGTVNGMHVMSGAEYNVGSLRDGAEGVYHIIALGCKKDPCMTPEHAPQEVIDAIHACGGLAILAHPYWSLNRVEKTSKLRGVDATEIYNTVSDAGQSARPYSGHFVDISAGIGLCYPLLAADDTHFYAGDDETKSFIMVEGDENSTDDDVLAAIRQKRFYASQGPEIHIRREGNEIVVNSSPVKRVNIFSNTVFGFDHCFRDGNYTEVRCKIEPYETFFRAEVFDEDGRAAWSNILTI